jgi:dTMP kinase
MKLRRESLFVTFEGIDGCGKTTQLKLTADYLTSLGYKVDTMREPGSTEVSEKIRMILLDKKSAMTDMTELLLYEAARAEITAREIAPLLKKGHVVLCDRFYDSTTAYQGYGRGLNIKMIKTLHRIAVGDIRPDLSFVFDLPLKTAAGRMGITRDRLESQPQAFHRRVRAGFVELARKENRRVKLVDATRPIESVFEDVKKHLDRKLAVR